MWPLWPAQPADDQLPGIFTRAAGAAGKQQEQGPRSAQKPGKSSSRHSCRPPRARRRLRLPLPFACKAALLVAGLLLALHTLSCGFFFCVRLVPWTLDLSGDASHDLYGLYGLSGALPGCCLVLNRVRLGQAAPCETCAKPCCCCCLCKSSMQIADPGAVIQAAQRG